MKKLLLSLLGLGISGFMCQAQIAVYKINLKDTTTGNGQTIKGTTTGYFIVDFGASEVGFIQVFASKHFISYDPNTGDYDYSGLIGSNGAQSWAFSLSKTFGGLTASGKAAPLNLGTTNATITLPKTMTVTGSVMTSNTSNVRSLDQFSGSFVFDLTDSATANQLGDALADTENRLITFLQSKGDIYDGAQ